MKNVKIVIGANYGDEGKGLMTRYFSLNNKDNSIIVFHNGTAQRGHTIDYNGYCKHVYHHFGSGTKEGIPTYYSDTFLVHPMEYCRELEELKNEGISVPLSFCSPECIVVTPFDMLVDQITQEYIENKNGTREYGSCSYGSWCATERAKLHKFTVIDFMHNMCTVNEFLILDTIYHDCCKILSDRGINLTNFDTKYSKYLTSTNSRTNLVNHFIQDIMTFLNKTYIVDFNTIYNDFNTIIFENGQGLGLDKNLDSEWTTTSNTGIFNPYNLLKDKEDYRAEVCYVTRTYLTRHGHGPLENEVDKQHINSKIYDSTNVFNEFQGSLRFGKLDVEMLNKRIDNDFDIVKNDNRFYKTIALTHCNEYEISNEINYTYMSNSPFIAYKRNEVE